MASDTRAVADRGARNASLEEAGPSPRCLAPEPDLPSRAHCTYGL
jgi:hypothetical protein